MGLALSRALGATRVVTRKIGMDFAAFPADVQRLIVKNLRRESHAAKVIQRRFRAAGGAFFGIVRNWHRQPPCVPQYEFNQSEPYVFM